MGVDSVGHYDVAVASSPWRMKAHLDSSSDDDDGAARVKWHPVQGSALNSTTDTITAVPYQLPASEELASEYAAFIATGYTVSFVIFAVIYYFFDMKQNYGWYIFIPFFWYRV